MEYGNVILTERHLGRAQQRRRFLAAQHQVRRTYLQDPALRA
jgi:hypothetical protein